MAAVSPPPGSPPQGTAQSRRLFSEASLLAMDETVREVFGVMLGIDIVHSAPFNPMDDEPNRHHEQTAVIGFVGIVSGLLEVRISVPASVAITSAMLSGLRVDDNSKWICDSIGELCNLLAGGWKNRLPDLGAACSLSVPTVIAGAEYQVHRPANVLAARRSYTFGDQHILLLTLVSHPDVCHPDDSA